MTLSEPISHKQSCIKHFAQSCSQNTVSWSTCSGISLYACHMKRFTIWLEAHHLCETWCMSHAYQDFRNLKGLIVSCLCYNHVIIQKSMSARIYLTKGTCLECILSLGRGLAETDELHPKSLKWLEIILINPNMIMNCVMVLSLLFTFLYHVQCVIPLILCLYKWSLYKLRTS